MFERRTQHGVTTMAFRGTLGYDDWELGECPDGDLSLCSTADEGDVLFLDREKASHLGRALLVYAGTGVLPLGLAVEPDPEPEADDDPLARFDALLAELQARVATLEGRREPTADAEIDRLNREFPAGREVHYRSFRGGSVWAGAIDGPFFRADNGDAVARVRDGLGGIRYSHLIEPRD